MKQRQYDLQEKEAPSECSVHNLDCYERRASDSCRSERISLMRSVDSSAKILNSDPSSSESRSGAARLRATRNTRPLEIKCFQAPSKIPTLHHILLYNIEEKAPSGMMFQHDVGTV